MAYEIIYVCNSINNKNVREGELKILRKIESQLCFEFGSDEMNIKKRFYNDSKTLNKDYEALIKLKEKIDNKKEEKKEEVKKTEVVDDEIKVEEINKKLESEKVTKHKITKKRK